MKGHINVTQHEVPIYGAVLDPKAQASGAKSSCLMIFKFISSPSIYSVYVTIYLGHTVF